MGLIIRNWKLISIAVLVMAGVWVGGSVTWKIHGLTIDQQKTTIARLQADCVAAQKANQENLKMISVLKDEQRRSDALCSDRLKVRDRLTARIREIDTIRTPKGRTYEKGPAADPLLDRLNGMFGAPDGR